jgi:hypothetical protein
LSGRGDEKVASEEQGADQQPEQPLVYARVTETVTSAVPNKYGIADPAAGERCFYCGEDVTDPVIHWQGETGEIYLHKACALDLVVRVLRDVHELENPEYYRRLKSGG